MIANQNLSKPLPAVCIPPSLFLQIRKQINLSVFRREKSAPLKQKAGGPQTKETSEFEEEASSEKSNFFSFSAIFLIPILKDLNYDDKF